MVPNYALIAVASVLALMDVVCTGIAIHKKCCTEMNPLARWCFEKMGVVWTSAIFLILNAAVIVVFALAIWHPLARDLLIFHIGTRFVACFLHLCWIKDIIGKRGSDDGRVKT